MRKQCSDTTTRACLSACISKCLSTCLSTCLHTCLRTVDMSARIPPEMPPDMPTHMSKCPYTCLHTCLHDCERTSKHLQDTDCIDHHVHDLGIDTSPMHARAHTRAHTCTLAWARTHGHESKNVCEHSHRWACISRTTKHARGQTS